MHIFKPGTAAAIFGALLFALAPQQAATQQRPIPTPTLTKAEDVGFSSAGLQRLVGALNDDVKAGTIPGGIVVIGRRGKTVLFEPFGELDPESKTPMSRDAIFRIYSMSKPITSIAAMMLVEAGKLSLADPVSKYIPEFAETKVGVEKVGADGKVTLDLIAPRRQMTVHDLMRHTSGLTYGFFGTGAVKKTYLDSQGIFGLDLPNSEFSKKLASLPLMHQPRSSRASPCISS
jgi:CubicO group peptidase (beta-lactamase class C family)